MADRREKSAEAVVAKGFGERGPPQRKGPNGEESETTVNHEEAGHQMSNAQFELPLESRGEAPTGTWRGEAESTRHDSERSGLVDLMEQVVERGNLVARAYAGACESGKCRSGWNDGGRIPQLSA
jgi:hypothetical protein